MDEKSKRFRKFVIKHTNFLAKENIGILQICINIFTLVVIATAYLQKTILDIRTEHYRTIAGKASKFITLNRRLIQKLRQKNVKPKLVKK